MKYILFYTGCASTPNSIGLLCQTTHSIVCEIETTRPTGKETRERYEKIKSILNRKYSTILN